MQVERESPSGDESGARVRNAYATNPRRGDSRWKRRVSPHSPQVGHPTCGKAEAVGDGHASH